ncbi:hypothetical protein KAS08_03995 [Candidatus Pacearchaeota archaeon]|nr:hypothetical protein [Candidatus Pacearchaeota archaeon]
MGIEYSRNNKGSEERIAEQESKLSGYVSKAKSSHKLAVSDQRSYNSNRDNSKFEKFKPKAIEHYKEASKYWTLASNVVYNELNLAIEDKNDILQKRLEKKAKMYFDNSEENIEDMRELKGLDISLAIPILSMVSFFFALVFSSFSVTGLVIADKITPPMNYVALGCFMLGILFALIYLKRRINVKKKSLKKIVRKVSNNKKGPKKK